MANFDEPVLDFDDRVVWRVVTSGGAPQGQYPGMRWDRMEQASVERGVPVYDLVLVDEHAAGLGADLTGLDAFIGRTERVMDQDPAVVSYEWAGD